MFVHFDKQTKITVQKRQKSLANMGLSLIFAAQRSGGQSGRFLAVCPLNYTVANRRDRPKDMRLPQL